MNNPLSTLDLKLACPACSVQSNEITYTLNVVDHQCAHNLLFARGRGTHYWRPISRRPAFPSPIKYEVCWHFVEGKGCTQHKNRCTFARSEEEATVWTFEKFQGLDHSSFCKLVAQDEGITAKQIDAHPGQFESLDDLLETIALKAACHRCSVEEQEITYSIQRVNHMCSKHLLLAKFKDSNHWRPVSSCPSIGNCGSGVVYQVCKFFKEGSGCTKDRDKCTFARSKEEAAVWNFAKDKNIDRDTLLQQVAFHESNSLQPERFADDIFKEFSGKFLELCKDCFLSSPQKVTATKLGDCCSAGAAHPWNPILVHHASESHGKEVYSEVRPLPAQCKFEYCRHVSEGKPCWHETTQCLSAHSEVEMAVWKAENGGRPVRPQLVRLSEERQDDCREAAFYCKACFLTLSSEESFMQHCSSQEHAQMISGDITTQWDARPPPHNSREEFCLCERPDTCEYGDNCLKAHSKEELREWQMRAQEEKEIRSNVDAQGLMPYAERLLEEFKTSKIEAHVISEQVDDVCVTCDEELFVECAKSDARLRWNFHVNTERQLVHVALMKHEPGALFSLHELTSESCAYSPGEDFQDQTKQSNDVTVFFQSLIPGLYEQWLVLDFGMRPVLLRKLKVRVGKLSPAFVDDPAENCGISFQSLERWHRGNRIIVPCTDRNDEQEKLLNKYKPPSAGFPHKHIDYDRQTSLTPENYKEKMHSFLYSEEQAEEKLLSRLSVCAEITTSTTLRMNQGELFCTFSFPCEITPEGFMLRRSLRSCLITPSSPGDQSSKVYEAVIIKETTNKNKMHLKLSKRCCSELGLKNNETHLMEVQFQLDRLSFCMMHKAVDLLPDTKRVLPDLHNCEVPVNRTQCHKLNDKQQSAVDFITGESDSSKDVAPLLIYGPFGTGKTFTLATAARELTKKRQNKVLICTHTNSSADLYVKDHFHSFISQKDHWIRPVRIKTNKHGTALQATDEITLKYCLLSKTGYYFLPPTRAALDGHNIVITTTTMARRFHELQLPKGYFTHILIDEASQMLECEALIPLGLAGPNTRVVLAGDHMQMGPKLFSVEDHQRSDHTLLNRMFHYYQNQKSFAAEKSKIIFNQNYRSTKEIVDFASTHTYVGKSDIVKADEKVPSGPNDHSLMFHHVRGDCQLDIVSMSCFNHAEVTEVVEVVQDILKKWPDSWGRQDQSSVCVLSEGWQVRKIRTALWKKHLDNVNVENFANVQGKEFRVVIITAVQTRESLNSAHMPGLELFNDARVLNTAITRAKSLVVVVGDATALCHFGKCSRVWKAYVDHCISKESVQPNHLTKVFLEREVKEILRFQRPEQPNESFVDTDTILQEMIEEYDQCETKYTSLEDTPEFRPHDDEKLSHSEPVTHKRGQLVIESLSRGYVIPFDDPTKRLHLKGKSSLGKAFNGDEVLVETSFSDNISQNKVVKITDSEHVFVCTLEEHPSRSKPRHPSQDNSQRWLMIPIAKNNPKICILVPRKSGNVIPVWEWIGGYSKIVRGYNLNENPTDNVVFMVKVIFWKEGYTFPLGKVVGFFPVGSSLDEGLRILKMEFNVLPTATNSNWMINEEVSNKKEIKRTDLRGIFTFTVDPKTAEDLDDAISVKDIGDKYEVGVHIADVASFVRLGDSLDEMAKENGATYYNKGGEPTHMFPHKLSTKDWSLLPGLDRKVVSLMMTVEKETNNIVGKPNFQLSLINSNKKLSYKQAEDIICQKIKEISKFNTVEDSVAVAYRFAKDQRKARLTNWAYCQTDKQREPGKRKAHLMIEELNVLFNKFSAQTLIGEQDTKKCTPLRCQDRPDPKKVEELKEEYGELLPLSFELRHIVDYDQKTANSKSPECFCILSKVWKDIQEAAKEGTDTDKIVDLIAADDIHPHLMPVLSQYKKSLSKAFLIRSNSSDRATIGHYSMELKCYTQASSPIRRYMDVVLQRLLHTVICGTPVQYSAKDIDILCEQFEQVMRTTKEYEQKSEILAFATSMKKHNVSKLAVIVCVDPDRDNFRVSFPFDHDAFPDSVPIMYRDLQLEDQPVHDKKSNSATLKWRRRIYSISSTEIQVKMRQNNSSCTQLPHATWKAIVDAIVDENWTELKSLIMGARTKQLENVKNPGEHGKEAGQHYIDLDLQVKPGDTLQVQMTSEIKRGYLMPTVQLVCLNKNFEVCVDHAHSPIICFSKSANCPTRAVYEDTDEYVEIWKPLCDMESATTAVDDSDSIIIEDLLVNFHGEQRHGARDKSYLKGSFNLPLTFIKEWAIKCNLAKCLLCIRKRGLELTKSEYSKEVDPSTFTWVAHGVTVKSEEVKTPSGKAHKVDFYVKHLPMKTRPNCVFQKNTTFTVEIIPKLLPDIRKENAVINIASACNLVQGLALGKDIPREVVQNLVQRWKLIQKKAPEGLPTLNETQFDAVERALKHNFTVIQGPPGTGKTVVGVYIVFWFCELNPKMSRMFTNPKDKNKKEVILYCGPSNKSVDVVAEYLLKFGDTLKPLRVYSQQVEMLDYPCPDGSLQSSHSSRRQERSKKELRSITLHHRMREEHNPSSAAIKEFDQKIETQQLTDGEVDEYQLLLRKARKYELERHDIVLCTCTASSSPTLTSTVSARQILIDECAMATEPQALIPLVCNNPEKIVLLGDHKQLRPIVNNYHVRKLGMSLSLFERYFNRNKARAVRLDIQYRMHEDICKFPSDEYYEGSLKTRVECPNSVLLVSKKAKHIVFGHIEGQEISLVVSTEKGNENSKANAAEKDIVVNIAENLVKKAKVAQQDIVILSPYNAQVSNIKAQLRRLKMRDITVTTITRSQGSEWRYVLISTVRSLPSKEIEKEPDRAWLSKNIGFVGDANQINVGISRAKEGLCIIGNQKLLSSSWAWKKLLAHYMATGSVTTAEDISVRQVQR